MEVNIRMATTPDGTMVVLTLTAPEAFTGADVKEALYEYLKNPVFNEQGEDTNDPA